MLLLSLCVTSAVIKLKHCNAFLLRTVTHEFHVSINPGEPN